MLGMGEMGGKIEPVEEGHPGSALVKYGPSWVFAPQLTEYHAQYH